MRHASWTVWRRCGPAAHLHHGAPVNRPPTCTAATMRCASASSRVGDSCCTACSAQPKVSAQCAANLHGRQGRLAHPARHRQLQLVEQVMQRQPSRTLPTWWVVPGTNSSQGECAASGAESSCSSPAGFRLPAGRRDGKRGKQMIPTYLPGDLSLSCRLARMQTTH